MGVLVPIADGRLHFGASLADVATTLYAQLARRVGVRVPPLSQVDADATPATAAILGNRWAARCPEPGCGGAEFLWVEGPAQMLCAACWNAGIGGAWRPVLFPDEADFTAIEDALAARPLPQQRNWEPAQGETAADLRRENRERGLPEEADWGPLGRPERPTPPRPPTPEPPREPPGGGGMGGQGQGRSVHRLGAPKGAR